MKSLMVVYDENYAPDATILRGLVSEKFSKKENDSFEVGLMSDKEYVDNKSTVSSSQKIVFIGDVDEKKGLESVMKVLYDRHGVKIGQHGNMMLVTTDVTDLYSMFKKPYSSFITEFRNRFDVPVAKKERKHDADWKTVLRVLALYNIPVAGPALSTKDSLECIQDLKLTQEQQRCFAMYVLADHLEQFMKA